MLTLTPNNLVSQPVRALGIANTRRLRDEGVGGEGEHRGSSLSGLWGFR